MLWQRSCSASQSSAAFRRRSWRSQASVTDILAPRPVGMDSLSRILLSRGTDQVGARDRQEFRVRTFPVPPRSGDSQYVRPGSGRGHPECIRAAPGRWDTGRARAVRNALESWEKKKGEGRHGFEKGFGEIGVSISFFRFSCSRSHSTENGLKTLLLVTSRTHARRGKIWRITPPIWGQLPPVSYSYSLPDRLQAQWRHDVRSGGEHQRFPGLSRRGAEARYSFFFL